jgi:hypothetical protein
MTLPYAKATWTADLSAIAPQHMPPQSLIDELRCAGCKDDDIAIGILTQHAQRQTASAPVLPLRVIMGLDKPITAPRRKYDTMTAKIASTPRTYRKIKGGTHITHITRRPIWAGSVRTGGSEEAEFVRPMSKTGKRQLIHFAHRIYDFARDLAVLARKGRELNERERLLIDYISTSRDILMKLIDEAHYRKGWCVPAYETISRLTRYARSTVANHLTILRRLGVLEWVKRYNYDADETHGARSEQTSNLYRVTMPAWLATMLGIDTPLPDDEAARRDQRLEDQATMFANAGAVERRRMLPSEPSDRIALLQAAARLEQREATELQARESTEWIAPHHDIYNMRMMKRNGPSRAMCKP